MIAPQPAPVRPRVTARGDTELLPLVDRVCELLDAGTCGLVELAGPAGSGKRTALAHLAHAIQGEPRLLLFDGDTASKMGTAGLQRAAGDHLAIYPSMRPERQLRPDGVWRMAPWGTDEWIEYLLATHHDACRSVMRRIQSDSEQPAIGGWPELWRVVLDRMAGDETLTIKAAVRREIASRLHDAETRDAAQLWCFTLACHPQREKRMVDIDECEGISAGATSLLQYSEVKLLAAAEHVAATLRSGANHEVLATRFPEPLVRECAKLVRDDTRAIQAIQEISTESTAAGQPMAASLLHAVYGNWLPQPGTEPKLRGAYLNGVDWAGIQLKRLDIKNAALSEADLSEARLDVLWAEGAQLERTRFHGACVKYLSAPTSRLAKADLSYIRATAARMDGADLQGANLEGALFDRASFENADLRGASCCRAQFKRANFEQARLAEADFTGANLKSASLARLSLRNTNFDGAQFTQAILRDCDMEYMSLPGANFRGADLRRTLLTGSQIRDGQFAGAHLYGARLADIDWERADLSHADLRYCTFHLGSSRSGLVGSPIASEGSRTGFYTDEYHEQDFKAPEDIRKANLRGADLRGAHIEHVDFYLVDLRDALYTSEQEEVFRASKAILETRV